MPSTEGTIPVLTHLYESLPLILATGQGRSGTTVLTKALAEHPNILSNRVESNVMKDVLIAGFYSSTMPSRVRQMMLPREQHDLVFRRMLLNLLFPVATNGESSTTSEGPPQALSTFSAMNAEAAGFAASVFPGIHFANIVRNGIEVVSSRMVHRALGQHSFEEHCFAWSAAREMAEWGDGRSDFTLLRHEDLLDAGSCHSTFATLFERAGLSPSTRSAEYILNNKRNQTRYKDEDENADLATRRDRWQTWTNEQRSMFRDHCSESMAYFGYEIPE